MILCNIKSIKILNIDLYYLFYYIKYREPILLIKYIHLYNKITNLQINYLSNRDVIFQISLFFK